MQHGKFHSIRHTLDIRAVNKYKHKLNTEGDREFRGQDFGTMPLKLYKEYMDMYEGIQSEIVSATRFDENSDWSTTYLGRIDREQKQVKTRSHFQFQNMGILQVNCWMAQNVNCYWTQVQASHSCQNHSTCDVGHSAHCKNLPQRLREYK